MKLLTGLFCLLSLCVLVWANRDWRIHTMPQGEQVMPISIALTNNNLDWLRNTLAEVSNPRHPNWRKYVTQEELKEKTAPSASIVDFVGKYLEKNGATSLELYASGDFITANFKVRDLERMLNVKIRQYVHKITGEKILRATSQYTLPKDLVGLVDVIGMVSEFPASHLRTRTSGKDFRNRPQQQQALKESQPAPEEGVSSCVANPLSFGYPASSDTDLYSQVTINCCNGNGTRNVTAPCFDVDYPNVLQSFNVHVYSNVTGAYVYSAQVPYNPSVCSYDAGVGSVTCSLVFTPYAQLEPYGNYNIAVFANYTTLVSNMQFFPTALVTSPFVTPQVLAQAYGIYEPTRNVSLATSQSVVEFGGQYYSPTDLANFFGNMSLPQRTAVLVGPNDPSVPGDEATLDIEWIMAVSQVSETTFWSIKTGYLLEWTAQLLASNSPPLVNSVSYAGNEVDSPAVYRDRVDLQFQKLGAVGVSIVVASGDAGATDVGHGSDACNPFQPQYPSSSPFVTTVSATFFTPKSDPICWGNYYGKQVHCGGQIGEISVTANLGMDWTTGGGFSNHVPQQSWQSTAVNNYLQHSGAVLPPSSMFNASGRAYPDVSANGHNLVLINNGVMDIGDGTSASTPIFTGFLALINNYLATIGENPVGFATPLLYEIQANYPSAFYDVTYGNNYCGDVLHPPYIACCEYGYNCAVGWDPVTGLGTPRLSGLLSAVQDLVSQQKSKQ